jgi:uncharacterized Fe-S center protein
VASRGLSCMELSVRTQKKKARSVYVAVMTEVHIKCDCSRIYSSFIFKKCNYLFARDPC